jgi:hypothetical protein
MTSKKSRLSTQQWLNIIIFSISFLFLLFILLGRMMTSSDDGMSQTEQPVANTSLFENNLIAIDFGDFQFQSELSQQSESQRDKLSWSSNDGVLLEQEVERIATNWQNLLNSEGENLDNEFPQGKTVLLFIANQKEPLAAKVLKSDQLLTISFPSQRQAFYFPAGAYSRFYPDSSK